MSKEHTPRKKAHTMKLGTSHFDSEASAVNYYESQCYGDAYRAVTIKIREGSIKIGPPTCGNPYGVDSDGRYWVTVPNDEG